jgi:tyrosine-protein kinase Etk/Wzc
MSIIEDITNPKDQDRGEPDLRETLFVYLRYWKWFVVSVVLFTFLGVVYVKLQTPQYKIETDLLIKPDNKSSSNSQNDLLKDLDLFSSDKIIDNEIQILKSKTLIENVVKELKLETSYFGDEKIKKKEIYGDLPLEVHLITPSSKAYQTDLPIRLLNEKEVEVNGKKFAINGPIQTDAGTIEVKPTGTGSFKKLLHIKFNYIEDLVQNYSANLKIDPASKQATVLIITLEDPVPQKGMDFLNRLVTEYNRAALTDKNKVTSNTLTFIQGRIGVIATELGRVEKNVELYKSNNEITDISSESQIFLQAVQDNDGQLNKVLIQLSVLDNLQNYLRKNDNQPSTLPSMLGIEDPTLLGLVSQLGDAQLKKLSLLQTVPETNPLVTTFTDQITALKRAISASVQNLKKGLEITQQQLQLKNNQFESTIKKVPSKERGLVDVVRQKDIQNSLYTYLLQKQEETEMQLASDVADSRTIDTARSSRAPVKPVRNVIYLIFFITGIVLPAAVIYLKNILNFKVTRTLDIESITKVPIMAEISMADNPSALLVVSEPRSRVAEQIRALRTNLQFVMPSESQKVILFTSSISGEGKSFVSLNLGASLAMSGKRVVIMELDLRKPKLHVGLDIDNTLGLSNYLIGKASLKEILKEIPDQENYYIITSGPIPPNPAELLVNGHISELIDVLKNDFDYIVLDAPPVGLVTDAQILGAYADATMFIIRHNYTAKNQIYAIDNYHRSKKFNNLNIIVNSINLQRGYGYGYGYSYGYGYGYGYGGYYHEDSKNDRSRWAGLFKRKKVKKAK